MNSIRKELKIGIASEKAFNKFLNEFNQWWLKEYTWSQDRLKNIYIDAQPDGLSTEIGAY